MTRDPAITEMNLPDDVPTLHAMIRELLATLHDRDRQSEQLQHRLDQLLKRLYGPRADKLDPAQLLLIDVPPPVNEVPLPPNEPEIPARNTPRCRHGRRTLPKHLPRKTETLDIPEAEKRAVGGNWVQIGEEVSEKLDYTPSSLFVQQIIRPKYIIRFEEAKPDTFAIADLPPEAMPKSMAAPGLVADVIVSKLVDHLPLYRQEQRYSRQGFEIARSTLCGWMAEAAQVLMPVYWLLKTRVLNEPVVHTDDTPIPVQDATREHCRTGRLWTYVSAGGIVYDATADRCREGPRDFLQGFQGYLQCDAYPGYDILFADGTILEVACWAHARRKFVEAQKSSPRLAHEAVARIRQLYDMEDAAKSLEAPARAALRQEKSVPILASLGRWLDEIRPSVLPKSPLGEAITYATNQWAALNVYVRDGNVSIDNNVAERAIKPFAIGRKNWLFFGSDRGGQTLAVLASFTATCGQLGINPWTYLRDTLTALPTTPKEELAKLLPAKPIETAKG